MPAALNHPDGGKGPSQHWLYALAAWFLGYKPHEVKSAIKKNKGLPTCREIQIKGGLVSPPPNASVKELRRLIGKHLAPSDVEMFEKATGSSISMLLGKINDETASAAMSNSKMVGHELNKYGLHPLRALLSERLTNSLRNKRAKSWSRTPELADIISTAISTGIVVFPLSRPLDSCNSLQFDDGMILKVLHGISGYRDVHATRISEYTEFTHSSKDEQYYMHVDTFFPTWKVFIFAPNTTVSSGAFHYVRGSHRNTEGKLRWLYDRTKTWTKDRPFKELDKSQLGPFSDNLHGYEGSIRMLGFNPPKGVVEEGNSLGSYSFGSPEPITVGDGYGSIVIADTSGLHYRGYAAPGAKRTAARIMSSGGGCGGCVPRLNPFRCDSYAKEC